MDHPVLTVIYQITIVIFTAEFRIAVHVSEDVRTGLPACTFHVFAAHVKGVESKHVKELGVNLAEDIKNLLFGRVELHTKSWTD